MSTRRLVAVTGATGNVGGRLPALLARGGHVRCLARRPEAIAPRPSPEVVPGDALDAEAARDADVQRIVYLGGLGSGRDLSTHLASRRAIGRLLASTGVETIEFHASIVIGSGTDTPAVGSALDFRRVEAHEPDRLLRLSAEMRVPGLDPAGLLYRYGLLPLHRLVFAGMLDGVARRAEAAR